MTEMDARHVRHRPRSTNQLTTGTFSNHDSGRRHDVQCDAGQVTEAWSGSRWMQTLRKLPISSPNNPNAMTRNGVIEGP
jgi:hypothetical protein